MENSTLSYETGINAPLKTALTDLHWFNIPGFPPKDTTRFDAFFPHLQWLTGLPLDTPLYIYMANGQMADLVMMDHSERTIATLNERGVHFFLYEPICSYLEGESYNQEFYTEFASDIDISRLRSSELDSIKEYVIQNKLTNVTVHTCDYDIDKFYQYYTPYMTLLCDDLFLKNQTVFNNIGPELTYDFTKKFICVNWRSNKHRHLMSAYLCTMESHISWAFEISKEVLADGLWFNLEDWKTRNPMGPWLYNNIVDRVEYLNFMTPFNLDIHHTRSIKLETGRRTYFPVDDYSTPSSTNQQNNSLEKFYRDAFVDIVTETRFAQPTGNFSEKVYQAIVHRKPFIVVAPPNTVKYIKESGFKTFSDFWNESYDSCLNHEDRLVRIFKLIDWINAKPLDELKEMYKQMKDIVEYNYELLVTKTPFKSIQILAEE